MNTLSHANPSQHPNLSGWAVAQKALCNKVIMVYNLYNSYKRGLWLINPKQGPSCKCHQELQDAGKLQIKNHPELDLGREQSRNPRSTRLCHAQDLFAALLS